MSRSQKRYARKAERFVVKNPLDDASQRMIDTCNWLLRSRQHGVEFGNEAVETLANNPKRCQCDAIIKHLSHQPVLKATKRTPKPDPECQPNTDAVIAEMARKGKLGKVAQRKALAV